MDQLPNRQELSPLNFLNRANIVYKKKLAIEDGDIKYDWYTFNKKVHQFASVLKKMGIKKQDKIAFLAFNCESFLIAHYAVPLIGAILVSINTRLSKAEVSYILEHSDSQLVFYSSDLSELVDERFEAVAYNLKTQWPLMLEAIEFETHTINIDSEDDIISINYTSGTTGFPKGVMYSHRGAYLNALAMMIGHKLDENSRYLWTLPMFHCNGWTFPWAMAASGATSICLQAINDKEIWQQLVKNDISHFCAAPTVLTMLTHSKYAINLAHSIRIFTAGASPSPTLIKEVSALGFILDHVYGLTEIYGPLTHQVVELDHDDITIEACHKLAQQGYPNLYF